MDEIKETTKTKEYIKDFPVKDLIQCGRNPRKNNGAVDALARSIQRVGNNDPIEVNEDYVILCGHTRLKALKKLGILKTDIIVISGMTEKQQLEYRITNNKTGELAEWDFEILEADFDSEELAEFGFDLGLENNIEDRDNKTESEFLIMSLKMKDFEIKRKFIEMLDYCCTHKAKNINDKFTDFVEVVYEAKKTGRLLLQEENLG